MKFITLELRSRLQSCNVFISMQRNLNFENVQVILSESDIVLIFESCKMKLLLPSIKIIPTSLSSLNIIDEWICFRLQTEPSKPMFGSFNTEVVTNSIKSIQSVTCPQILHNIKILVKETECTILCTCCKSIISRLVTFKRFLPFPDTEYNSDEWFCCKHSSNVIPNSLQIQETDYLYGSWFVILHKDIFKDNLHIDNKTLVCSKCLLHIGTFHADNLFKIWNCCVDYKPNSIQLSIVNSTDPLNDFLIIIKNSLNEVLEEDIILRSSLGELTHYLLIKSMKCQLDLITEPNVISDTDIISLQRKYVTKVLYKYETHKTDVITNCLDSKYYEVSLSIIDAGLKYLLSSTKRLPHIYRTTADYLFGYIILQEIMD